MVTYGVTLKCGLWVGLIGGGGGGVRASKDRTETRDEEEPLGLFSIVNVLSHYSSFVAVGNS